MRVNSSRRPFGCSTASAPARGQCERGRNCAQRAGCRPAVRHGRRLRTCSRRRNSWCPAWASTGRTNRQIADEVYLSHRTVAAHLSRAFTKLGISRRSQLMGVLGPSDPTE
ncbi:response regulator transcription factor [Curtobacterium sp. SORGH_AS_0776]|uniref:response regulator transcription factor n=1 Tax=Curtobacterium sp. SORGH_AS_0776 TaxID=3041798 RepID=UPI0037BF56D0